MMECLSGALSADACYAALRETFSDICYYKDPHSCHLEIQVRGYPDQNPKLPYPTMYRHAPGLSFAYYI